MDKTIAIKAADDALANVGVTEDGGENAGKWIKVYLEAVNLPEGYSWCGGFIKYRFIAAADKLNKKLPDDFLKLDGWTPSWAAWAKNNKIWIPVQDAKENPSLIKKGYIYCFYSKQKGRIYHVGIYLGPDTDTETAFDFIGVEGNTNSDEGVVANGDGVYRKRRTFSQLGYYGGFIKTY